MIFRNKFGHTFRQGDKVVAVVKGYSHSVSTITGTLIGLSKSGNFQILTEDKWQPKKTRISTLRDNLMFPLPEVK